VPQPGDFVCIPTPGNMGLGIEAGSYLAQKLEHVKNLRLQPYDHAEVYVGQPDEHGPHGYTYSAYPDNGSKGSTGKRRLPCPPAELPGSVWSSGIITLTPQQRTGIIAWCEAHPCVAYSWPDYGAIGLHALGVNANWLREYITGTGSLICSYYTDRAYSEGGWVHLFDDGRWEGYVTPMDLAGLLLDKAAALRR
jgi:hypothetical protein